MAVLNHSDKMEFKKLKRSFRMTLASNPSQPLRVTIGPVVVDSVACDTDFVLEVVDKEEADTLFSLKKQVESWVNSAATQAASKQKAESFTKQPELPFYTRLSDSQFLCVVSLETLVYNHFSRSDDPLQPMVLERGVLLNGKGGEAVPLKPGDIVTIEAIVELTHANGRITVHLKPFFVHKG
jgi:hypothetical protein